MLHQLASYCHYQRLHNRLLENGLLSILLSCELVNLKISLINDKFKEEQAHLVLPIITIGCSPYRKWNNFISTYINNDRKLIRQVFSIIYKHIPTTIFYPVTQTGSTEHFMSIKPLRSQQRRLVSWYSFQGFYSVSQPRSKGSSARCAQRIETTIQFDNQLEKIQVSFD